MGSIAWKNQGANASTHAAARSSCPPAADGGFTPPGFVMAGGGRLAAAGTGGLPPAPMGGLAPTDGFAGTTGLGLGAGGGPLCPIPEAGLDPAGEPAPFEVAAAGAGGAGAGGGRRATGGGGAACSTSFRLRDVSSVRRQGRRRKLTNLMVPIPLDHSSRPSTSLQWVSIVQTLFAP